MEYTQSQQGYYSPTHPAMLPGDEMKGKPVNGRREWVYPILIDAGDLGLLVQKSADANKEGAVVPIKEYLAP